MSQKGESYLVIARKYRPHSFASVSGQEHVTRTLQNALKTGRIAHAYLFAGPRGVGKTSLARIFSRALNCLASDAPAAEPCGECSNCQEILRGTSLTVREIDGASHNSVDHVRELIDNFRSLPAPGYRYKVYIIDEVHMLSLSAFNALLKSLEEPPPHTVFILATTEAHKIPDTVLSRVQRFDFRALGGSAVIDRLRSIATAEGAAIEEEVLQLIFRLSEGSMRDAQSLLDRALSYGGTNVTLSEVTRVFGVAEQRVFFELAAAIVSRKAPDALELVASVFREGLDPGLFIRELVAFWRALVIISFGSENVIAELGYPEGELRRIRELLASLSQQDLHDLNALVRTGGDAALRSAFPRYALEALVVRLATRERVRDLGAVIAWLRSDAGARAAPEPTAPVTAVSSSNYSRASDDDRPATANLSAPSPVQRRQSSPPAEPVRVSAPDAAAAPRAPESAPPSGVPGGDSAGALQWERFVSAVLQRGARVMAEQLKRCRPEVFTAGKLVLQAPEFPLRYLSESSNREKLTALLSEFSKAPSWKVDLVREASGGKPEVRSIVEREREARAAQDAQMESHPAIKELQRVFPGTKIEKIR